MSLSKTFEWERCNTKNTNKTMHYIRKNRNIEAIIYLSGEKKAEQKLFCHMYCLEHNYEILNVVEDLNEVYDCDILVAANATKISRDPVEYYGIVNNLKDMGIEVEFAITEENANRYIDILTREFRKDRVG